MHLVTGGSGYFGETLVKHLRECGFKVRIFDINPPENPFLDVEIIVGDIRDPAVVSRACKGVTHIYHNVARRPLAKNKALFQSVNRDGTHILLKSALESQVEKIIYMSSSAIYGVPQSNPITEQTFPAPLEAYGKAKLEGEKLCREFIKKGLDITIMRPSTILGPGRLGVFQLLFEWLYQGWNIPIIGEGDNNYQFIHADDLSTACIKAALRKGSETFNIGTNRFGTMRQSLEGLIDYAGRKSKLRALPRSFAETLMKTANFLDLSPLGSYHTLRYSRPFYFDINKAIENLKWTPRYSNVEMLCQSYDWYCKNREDILSHKDKSFQRLMAKQGILQLVKYLP